MDDNVTKPIPTEALVDALLRTPYRPAVPASPIRVDPRATADERA